jgi:hypothetical protein
LPRVWRLAEAARAQSTLPPETDTAAAEVILMATAEHFWSR